MSIVQKIIRILLIIISYLALIAVVAAPMLFYSDQLTLEQNKIWMLVATVVWFASASCWIGTKKKGNA